MAEMTVGREMDAEVIRITGIDEYVPLMPGSGRGVRHCTPSGNIADAFTALNAVLAKRPKAWVTLASYSGHELWQCVFNLRERPTCNPQTVRDGTTPAEAICRAILALEATA